MRTLVLILVAAFGLMAPDGSYHLEFRTAFQVPAGAPTPDQRSRRVQAYLDAIEDQIRRHPANSSDYFFWAEDRAGVVD